ncbi:MAG: RES family NAD+ phosphorylase [Burkholderiaceae bacterium]|nr:RES family NAD+ phosphorylase [Burkholderiaceae bacterium]
MTQVWRIAYCPSPTPKPTALLAGMGFGSTLGNGRWHIKGLQQIIYAGSTRALCHLEKRVHCNGASPRDMALMRLDLDPASKILDAHSLGLPKDWRTNETATQTMGMQWLADGKSLGLWVPSFVVPAENNLLINPAHPDFKGIKLVIESHPFFFDPRLFT